MFATGSADIKFCIFEENRHCARNAAHPTSENGKLAALTSGCPTFQQHVKRAEGSDTTPHLARSESTAHRVKKQQHHQVANRSRSPAGPRRLGTATRISASLSRRLSVFFVSTPGQGPKAAKYTFLIPGPGMFVNVRNTPRVVIAPPSETSPVSVCALVCDFSRRAECVPTFARESKCRPFVREVENRDERWSEIELLLMVRVLREPGNVCI